MSRKRGGTGGKQRPFRNFQKIHPFWRRQASLSPSHSHIVVLQCLCKSSLYSSASGLLSLLDLSGAVYVTCAITLLADGSGPVLVFTQPNATKSQHFLQIATTSSMQLRAIHAKHTTQPTKKQTQQSMEFNFQQNIITVEACKESPFRSLNLL